MRRASSAHSCSLSATVGRQDGTPGRPFLPFVAPTCNGPSPPRRCPEWSRSSSRRRRVQHHGLDGAGLAFELGQQLVSVALRDVRVRLVGTGDHGHKVRWDALYRFALVTAPCLPPCPPFVGVVTGPDIVARRSCTGRVDLVGFSSPPFRRLNPWGMTASPQGPVTVYSPSASSRTLGWLRACSNSSSVFFRASSACDISQWVKHKRPLCNMRGKKKSAEGIA